MYSYERDQIERIFENLPLYRESGRHTRWTFVAVVVVLIVTLFIFWWTQNAPLTYAVEIVLLIAAFSALGWEKPMGDGELARRAQRLLWAARLPRAASDPRLSDIKDVLERFEKRGPRGSYWLNFALKVQPFNFALLAVVGLFGSLALTWVKVEKVTFTLPAGTQTWFLLFGSFGLALIWLQEALRDLTARRVAALHEYARLRRDATS